MNVLIVDDQEDVLNSLKMTFPWEEMHIGQVFSALSAKEARVMMNCAVIDILITDIEMPEENGISLFNWVKEHYPLVEGIFLTAHADFSYALDALSAGAVSYILQPINPEELKKAIRKAEKRIRERHLSTRYESTWKTLNNQRDTILDGMMRKFNLHNYEEVNTSFKAFSEMYREEYIKPVFLPILMELSLKGEKNENHRQPTEHMMREMLEGVVTEDGAIAAVSSITNGRCLALVIGDEEWMTEAVYERRLSQFKRLAESNLDMKLSIYASKCTVPEDLSSLIKKLGQTADQNSKKVSGIFFEENTDVPAEKEQDDMALIQQYIRDNISRRITREELSDLVHLSPEYLSRLFHTETGRTLQDFIISEKLEYAKELLEKTRFSVSVISSKIGYDNFSHFSRSFKSYTGLSPQDYRKSINEPDK